MSETQQVICKFCKSPITADMIYTSTAICQKCGVVTEIVRPRGLLARALGPLLVFFAVVATGWYFKNGILFRISPKLAVRNMSETDVTAVIHQCLRTADEACLVAGYGRLNELEPTNVIYQANLAFSLTKTRQFAAAEPLYKKILDTGVGTYDLMAFYGTNFEGLGKIPEAIKWYEKALELSPNLMDVTKSLASGYVKSGRVFEAISLLRSFANNFPEAHGAVAGDISASVELLGRQKAEPAQSIRLVGLAEGHFGVPLEIKAGARPEIFLIDTGASTVMLPTADAEKYFPALMREAKPIKARLADGGIITAHEVIIPSLRLGAWEFKNVRAGYCERCERLAGMSLLKNLKMETVSRGEFNTLTLRR
jgi:clan AA aspartic protease (TIGR02281 family)